MGRLKRKKFMFKEEMHSFFLWMLKMHPESQPRLVERKKEVQWFSEN